MDRKLTQQDAADFYPKLCLLCKHLLDGVLAFLGLSQPNLCLVCSVYLTVHGLAFPVLSQPKLCLCCSFCLRAHALALLGLS